MTVRLRASKGRGHLSRRGGFALAAAVLLFALAAVSGAEAQDLGAGEFQILGTSFDISPETQAVPPGVGARVHATLPAPPGVQLPSDLVVRGELSGPGIEGTLSLATVPNDDFVLPPQSVRGEYVLADIRLMRSDRVIAYAAHRTATITVTDLLITQVTSRPLTYQEMVDKGIVISSADFTGYAFTVAMQVGSETVVFEIPILFRPDGPPVLPQLPMQLGSAPNAEHFRPPQIRAIELVGGGGIPQGTDPVGAPPIRIPTFLIIPGDVAFLNQVFSVSVIVQNGAPLGTGIRLEGLTAQPSLPAALQLYDSTPAVSLGSPVPLHDAGPDGQLGTGDDLTFVVAQAVAGCELVVKSFDRGTFDVPIVIEADVAGLTSGPLHLRQTAHGTILVRHPTFFITMDHPLTIREGETYTLTATVTNTSNVPANQVSLELDRNSISGAELLSDEVVLLGDIAGSDNAIATFEMRALRNGRVHSTAVFGSGGAAGMVVLRTGVGELGIPLSPDTLVLPREVDALADEALLTAARRLLGLGWSLAKSPGTDPALPAVGEFAVRWRVRDLAAAGRHQAIHQDQALALAEWTLGWLNASARRPARSFDALRRASAKGTAIAENVGRLLAGTLATESPAAFEQRLFALLPELPHVGVALGRGGDPARPLARLAVGLVGSAAETAFAAGETGALRGVPDAEIYPVHTPGGSWDYLWIGQPAAASYELRVLGQESGTVDLTITYPGADGSLVRVVFPAVPVAAGSLTTVSFTTGAAPGEIVLSSLTLGEMHGTPEILPPPPAAPIAAVQELSADPRGKAIAVLFNRAAASTGGSSLPANRFRMYAGSFEDPTNIALVQPDDLQLVVVGVTNHPSPYRDWRIETHDFAGEGTVGDVPVRIADQTPGGTVEGLVLNADGTPVPFAPALLKVEEISDTVGQIFLDDFAATRADAVGAYVLDYVPLRQGQVFRLEAADPVSGNHGSAHGQVRVPQEVRHINIVLSGRGEVYGVVTTSGGATVPGAYVQAASVFFDEEPVSTNADLNGAYSLTNLPVGPVQLSATAVIDGNASTAQRVAVIPAPGARTAANFELQTVLTGILAGTVERESTGAPAAGLYVALYGPEVGDGSFRDYYGVVVTDAAGSFRFDRVAQGFARIDVHDPARAFEVVTSLDVTIVFDREIQVELVILDGPARVGTIAGRVQFDNAGELTPAADVRVWVNGSSLATFTEGDGTYEIPVVPEGSHHVSVWDAASGLTSSRHVTVQGDLTATADFILVESVASGIEGAVTDPLGSAVAVANIAYFDAAGQVVAGVATNPATGRFRFENLAPGTYRLWASAVVTTGGETRDDVGYLDVTVSAGHVANVVIPLRGYGTVRGRVTARHLDEAGTQVDSPMQTRLVLDIPQRIEIGPYARLANPGDIAYPGPFETDSSFTTGDYSIPAVPVGEFGLRAHSPILGDLIVQGSVAHALQVVTKDFAFQGAAVVDGFLFDERGAPVADADIALYDGFLPGLPPVQSLASVRTDIAGYFRFAAASAGTRTVVFDASLNGRRRFAAAFVSVPARPVIVRATLYATRVQDVRVTVLSPSDNGTVPAVGAVVRISERQWPRRSYTVTAGEDGSALVAGVSEGAFTVRAQLNAQVGTGAGCVCAEGGTAEAQVLLSGSGEVAGRVTFPGSGAPVANAEVLVIRSNAASTLVAAGQTAEDGAYQIDGLPIGAGFWLLVSDPASGRSGATRPSFVLGADGEVHTADVTLIALGVVTGSFFDAGGARAITGADVTLTTNSVLGTYTLRTGTDGSGLFDVPGVPQGSFTLLARDIETARSARGSGTISAEGQVVTVPLRAGGLGSVYVRVVDASGSPLPPDAPPPIVTLAGGGDRRTVSTTEYLLENLAVGVAYSVAALEQASPPAYRAHAEFTLGADGEQLEIELRYVPIGNVAVEVLRELADGTRSPLTTGRVRLTSDGLYAGQFPFGHWVGVDAAGHATFLRVGGGTITATYEDAGLRLWGSASGELAADGETLALTVVVANVASVTGRVLAAAAGGAPAVGAIVSLEGRFTNIWGPVWVPFRSARTAADGTFQIADVPFGTWRLRVEDVTAPGLARQLLTVTEASAPAGVHALGDITLDGVAPSVVSIDPPSGATDLPRRQVFHLVFSEPITVEIGLVADSGSAIAGGALSLAADGSSANWTPSSDLAAGAAYTLVAKAGALEDEAGWTSAPFLATFTTRDDVGPRVVATTPAAGATHVSTEATFIATLDQAVDPASVAGAVTLRRIWPSETEVLGIVTLSADARTVVFDPDEPLSPAARYEATVADLSDTLGNIMSSSYVATFWTEDLAAPAVSFGSAPAELFVLHTYSFTVTFASLDVTRLVLRANGAQIASYAQAVGDTGRTFTYRPPASVAGMLVLTATATDVSGNVGQPAELSIPVVADARPYGEMTLDPTTPLVPGGTLHVLVTATDDFGLRRVTVTTSGAFAASVTNFISGIETTTIVDVVVPEGVASGAAINVNAIVTDNTEQTFALTGAATSVVADIASPQVILTAPLAGATFASGAGVSVLAAASDDTGVAKVVFAAGDQTFTDTTAPFTFAWVTPFVAANTDVVVSATAFDHFGHSAQQSVTVHIAFDLAPWGDLTLSSPSPILPGQTVTGTVTAQDDRGVDRITVSGSGAISGTQTTNTSGTPVTATFSFTVPVTAVAGDEAIVTATIWDTIDQPTTLTSVPTTVAADTAGPVIQSATPANGATVTSGDAVIVSVSATDNVGIKRVELTFDGDLFNDTSAPYSKMWPAPPVASVTTIPIRIVVYDYAENSTESNFTIQVQPLVNPDIPTVSITYPTTGALLPANFTVSISGKVTDDIAIQQVEVFINNNTSIGMANLVAVSPAPARPTWTFTKTYLIPSSTANNTVLPLLVKARDYAGNTAETTSVLTVVTGFTYTANATMAAGTHNNETIIVKSGILTIQGPHTFKNLVVVGTGSVRHPSSTTTTVDPLNLTFTEHGLYVGNGASIGPPSSVTINNGYLGGWAVSTDNGTGWTYPNTTVGGSGLYAGGSFAGAGKPGSGTGAGVAGMAYGSLFEPLELGAGAGGGSTTCCASKGGNGGGAVLLTATVGLPIRYVVDGQILAVGTGAGGSGGTISLRGSTLAGSGTLRAAGAPGSSTRGSGGGGRIAVHAEHDAFDTTRLLAEGGTVLTTFFNSAGAGTIYLERPGQEFGDLIVDNIGRDNAADTSLLAMGSGVVDAVAGDGVTISLSTPSAYGVVGEHLEFSRGGIVLGRRRIVARSTDGLAVTLEPGFALQPGDAFQGMYLFDSVTVRGAARVHSRDPIVAGTFAVAADSILSHGETDLVPDGSVTLSPPATVPQGGSVLVTVSATDDFAIRSIHTEVFGVATFDATETPFTKTFSKTYTVAIPSGATGTLTARVTIADDLRHTLVLPEATVTVIPEDVTPPTIQLSATPSPVLAGGQLTVSAELSDDYRLADLTLTGSGAATFTTTFTAIGTDQTTRSYVATVPVDAPNDGSIQITGRITDTAGHATDASSITVPIQPDVTGPSVSITNPAEGTVYTAGETIYAYASVTDNVAIPLVSFELNGIRIDDTSSPYTALHTAPRVSAPTSMPLTVSASDYAGNQTLVTRSVTVSPLVNAVAPTISLMCPSTSGALLPPGYVATISLVADDDDEVAVVEFFADGAATPFASLQTPNYYDGTQWRYRASLTVPGTASNGDTIPVLIRVYDYANNLTEAATLLRIATGEVISGFSSLSIGPNDLSHEGQMIFVTSYARLTVDGHHSFAGLAVLDQGLVTHPSVSALDVTLGELGLYVSCDATIDVSGRGYPAGQTIGGAPGSGTNAGGSHGGKGTGTAAAPAFGNLLRPVEPGGGGGQFGCCSGAGGGVVHIQAPIGSIDGKVLALGLEPGGAGGSIFLEVGTLGGPGSLDASGAGGLLGGGGGRIAIHASASTFDLNNVSARGGLAGGAGTIFVKLAEQSAGDLLVKNSAGGGTVAATPLQPPIASGVVSSVNGNAISDAAANFPTSAPGSWVEIERGGISVTTERIESVSAGGQTLTLASDISALVQAGDSYRGLHRFDAIAGTGALTLDLGMNGSLIDEKGTVLATTISFSGGTIVLRGGLRGGNATLASAAVLTHEAVSTTTAPTLALALSGILSISANSRIDVNGRGYLGGWSPGTGSIFGRTFGNVNGSGDRCGGSYGGLGAIWSGQPGQSARAYGSPFDPREPGAGGGGTGTGTRGGNGGGALYVIAGQIVLDGTITADGNIASGLAGSGAGGAIRLDTGTLTGAGSIHANGAVFTSSGFGAGGGGRIAIYGDVAPNLLDGTHIRAFGGAGGSANANLSGGAGTVFLKAAGESFGRLIVDGNGRLNPAQTPLVSAGTGSGVTGTATLGSSVYPTVTNSAASFEYSLFGLYARINGSVNDEFQIVHNEPQTLFLFAEPTGLLTPGGTVTYDGLLRLDSLLVKGGARLVSGDFLDCDFVTVETSSGSTLTVRP